MLIISVFGESNNDETKVTEVEALEALFEKEDHHLQLLQKIQIYLNIQ